jgi:hypothetical protein
MICLLIMIKVQISAIDEQFVLFCSLQKKEWLVGLVHTDIPPWVKFLQVSNLELEGLRLLMCLVSTPEKS